MKIGKTWLPILGSALGLTAVIPLSLCGAHAGSADTSGPAIHEKSGYQHQTGSASVAADIGYTSETIIDLLRRERAGDQSGNVRKICFENEAACEKTPPPQAPFELLVHFEFDSDRPTPRGRQLLANLARALIDPRLIGSKIAVDGYADATGPEAYDIDLSRRRAEGVVDYLVSLGVDRHALFSHPFGKSRPRVSDPYGPVNRRVEMRLAH